MKFRDLDVIMLVSPIPNDGRFRVGNIGTVLSDGLNDVYLVEILRQGTPEDVVSVHASAMTLLERNGVYATSDAARRISDALAILEPAL